MKLKSIAILLALSAVLFTSCSNNYSNGEKIGMITNFADRGLMWKTWEGHLNPTQTGMNSASGMDFSVDRKGPNVKEVISIIDSAANFGWKVKLVYHETMGLNWFSNRGESKYLVTSVEVLDREPVNHIFGDLKPSVQATSTTQGEAQVINLILQNGQTVTIKLDVDVK